MGLYDKDKMIQELLMIFIRLYFVKIYNQAEVYGLHPGQVALMKELSKREGMSQKELADALHIKPPTVAVSVKRMERSGFIKRKQDEFDQRMSRLYLTENGKNICDEMMKIVDDNEKVLFDGFEQGEVYLFKRFLKQMIDNLANSIPDDMKEVDFHEMDKKCRKAEKE